MDELTQGQVRDLVARGAARPLRAGYDPAPVWWDGVWWQLGRDAAADGPYTAATEAQSKVFDALATRLAAADAAVASTVGQRS